MFWLFSACAAVEDTPVEQAVLVDEEHSAKFTSPTEREPCPKTPRQDDVKIIENGQSRDFTHPSVPTDERNAHQQKQPSPTITPPTTDPTTSPATSNDQSGGSSDDVTPVPAEPLGTFSHFFQTQCVQECADGVGGPEDEDDSFLAVFDNPHFVAADRAAGYDAWPEQEAGPAQPQRTMKGLTIRVHKPRQILPATGYEVQWQVDPPLFTGLYRVQASVVREQFEAQYACSETGRPIEVHQEGERIEVARLTCYRMRPRLLRQHYDTSWKQKYPSVARFFEAVPDGPIAESYYQPRGMVQSVSQLLLEDLYVHPDYRGGGLGLSLVDHACRKVGDALASIVLGLPPPQASPSRSDQNPKMEAPHDEAPHDEPHPEVSCQEDEGDEDENTVNPEETTLEHYFGLLGFVHIHQNYMARAMGRVLLEEACPSAPVLDPNRLETY